MTEKSSKKMIKVKEHTNLKSESEMEEIVKKSKIMIEQFGEKPKLMPKRPGVKSKIVTEQPVKSRLETEQSGKKSKTVTEISKRVTESCGQAKERVAKDSTEKSKIVTEQSVKPKILIKRSSEKSKPVTELSGVKSKIVAKQPGDEPKIVTEQCIEKSKITNEQSGKISKTDSKQSGNKTEITMGQARQQLEIESEQSVDTLKILAEQGDEKIKKVTDWISKKSEGEMKARAGENLTIVKEKSNEKPKIMTKLKTTVNLTIMEKPKTSVKPEKMLEPKTALKPEVMPNPTRIVKPEIIKKPKIMTKPQITVKPKIMAKPKFMIKQPSENLKIIQEQFGEEPKVITEHSGKTSKIMTNQAEEKSKIMTEQTKIVKQTGKTKIMIEEFESEQSLQLMPGKMEKEKIFFKGTHPDSLYRVATESVIDSGKLARVTRAIRWPLALIVVCIALTVFVYFLMPENLATDVDGVNSTFWDNTLPVPSKGELLKNSVTSTEGPQSTMQTTKKPLSTRKPGTKTPEINFDDAVSEENGQLTTLIETITNRKPNKSIPVEPVFPTRINPEVQYGNENADSNKLRGSKALEKIDDSVKNTTVKPHITQQPEKPLSVYFEPTSKTTSRPTSVMKSQSTTSSATTSTSSTTSSPTSSLSTAASSTETTKLQNDEFSTEIKNYEVNEDVEEGHSHIPEKETLLLVDGQEKRLGSFNFTSGHSKYFGIGIEDAERMQSTTQSSLYNTRVSPTLPTWKDRDETTTKNYPINDYTNGDLRDLVPQCHTPRHAMCRGVLHYDLAGPAPTLDGQPIENMIPQMQYMIATNCSVRSEQFFCSLLEPECSPPPYPPKMPCYDLCKAVLDFCDGYIPRELVNAFHCRQYPRANCIGAKSPCDKREYQCVDGTCIPREWMCDGRRDCPEGEDEEPCLTCSRGQYKCSTSGSCIKREWLCDGFNDCTNGEDEEYNMCLSLRRGVSRSKKPAAALDEPEETAGSAPAPSVRRPNRLPEDRHRSDIRGDDSKELLITSDSGNALKRNFTRRPSLSRLTPYQPKPRLPVQTDANDNEEKPLNKPFKRYQTTPKVEQKESPEEMDIEELGLFKDFETDNPAQQKKQTGLENANPIVDKDVDEQKTKIYFSRNGKSKFERVIDGAALLKKAAEEAERLAEMTTEPTQTTTEDDFPSNPGPPLGQSHSSPSCPSGELRCVDGRCITLAQLCDGTIDCSDHADEDNCYT